MTHQDAYTLLAYGALGGILLTLLIVALASTLIARRRKHHRRRYTQSHWREILRG